MKLFCCSVVVAVVLAGCSEAPVALGVPDSGSSVDAGPSCPAQLSLGAPTLLTEALRTEPPRVQTLSLVVGTTRALISLRYETYEPGLFAACVAVLVDLAGRPISAPIEDPYCEVGRTVAVGDDFLSTLGEPEGGWRNVRVVFADGRVERRTSTYPRVGCATCLATAWRDGETFVVLVNELDGDTNVMLRFRFEPTETRSVILGRTATELDSGLVISSAARDTRGGLVLSESLSSPGSTWVQRIDADGNFLGAPTLQTELAPASAPALVRDGVYTFVSADGRLLFGRAGRSTLERGPPDAALAQVGLRLAATRSGYRAVTDEEVLELDPAGQVVSRAPRRRDVAAAPSPEGLVAAQLEVDEVRGVVVRAQGVESLIVPPRPLQLLELSSSSGPSGALVVWNELQSNITGTPARFAPGYALFDRRGRVTQPPRTLGLAQWQVTWTLGTSEGYWVALGRTLMALEVDGDSATLEGVAPLIRPAWLGDRALAVDEDGVRFLDVRGRELARLDLGVPASQSAGPWMLGSDSASERALLARSYADGDEYGVELIVVRRDGTRTPVTRNLSTIIPPFSMWTCGPGCWELAAARFASGRLRVELTESGVIATQVSDVGLVTAGAGDACEQAFATWDEENTLRWSGGGSAPGVADAVVALGDHHFLFTHLEDNQRVMMRLLAPQ